MRLLVAALFFLASPFWETKPPETWTTGEIETIRRESPWAQEIGPAPKVLAYLATAAPIEAAEAEARVRLTNPLAEPEPDYRDFLRQKRDQFFVLAIPYTNRSAFTQSAEVSRMEEETAMLIGRKRFRLAGHFPPVAEDPVLRLVFPREVEPADKQVVFRLYLPGVEFPDREATFRVKDLLYHGKLAM
jgi:hypothetical protein